MTITHIDPNARMSQAVIYGDTIYLAGQIGSPGTSVAEQTQTILEQIDTLLAKCGSRRDLILIATIWLANMDDFGEMNTVWDTWFADVTPPARATGEARLATPGHKVEIIVTAAKS